MVFEEYIILCRRSVFFTTIWTLTIAGTRGQSFILLLHTKWISKMYTQYIYQKPTGLHTHIRIQLHGGTPLNYASYSCSEDYLYPRRIDFDNKSRGLICCGWAQAPTDERAYRHIVARFAGPVAVASDTRTGTPRFACARALFIIGLRRVLSAFN